MPMLSTVPQLINPSIFRYGACAQAQVFGRRMVVPARARHLIAASCHHLLSPFQPISIRPFFFVPTHRAYEFQQTLGQDNPRDRLGARNVSWRHRTTIHGTVDFPKFNDKDEKLQWTGCKMQDGILYKDVIPGYGGEAAKPGDTVRIKVILYKMRSGKYESDEHWPPKQLTLGGKHVYGKGFDLGIPGMKPHGTRRIAIPKRLGPEKMPGSDWQVYDVSLLLNDTEDEHNGN